MISTLKWPFLIAVFLLLYSCSTGTENKRSQDEIHIVFIGLDGWGGHDFEQSLFHMNHVDHYKNIGIYTDSKQTVRPSDSAPNWASMFMGCTPDIHGYTEWNTKVPTISYSFSVFNNIFPT